MEQQTDANGVGAGGKLQNPTLERWFGLTAKGTTPEREMVAGVATFMTMAYIIFVNPIILSGAGISPQAVAAATCLGAALPTLVMGLWANYPFALASGMGLNAALAALATTPGMSWRTAMGVIVVEGVIISVLVLTRTREQVMQAIPMNLKRAIGVGIGLFIAFLGLQHMGWVTRGSDPGPFLTHGSLLAKPALVSTIGLLMIVGLMAIRVNGAILLGIMITSLVAGLADWLTPESKPLVMMPGSILARPDFSAFGHADILGALKPGLIGAIFAFLMTDFFDTMGTVIGVGGQGGFLDKQGKLPRLNRVLLVDSLAAVWGGVCGASSVTTYIESAAGVSCGGRTGLVSVVVALLFIAALCFSPIITAVPGVATAPALLVVGYLMMTVVRDMEFDSLEEGVPAFLTMLLIPLAQSISFGIGMGFIAYVVIKVLSGKGGEVSGWMYGIAALFAVSFAWG